jgi:glutamyl-tRNA synthetase
MIHRAFGWDEPQWVHLSIFLKPSGKGKMSKREAADLIKDGHSIFLKELRGLGYLPEAVINWVALMGWSYDDHTEFFTMQDLKEKFNLEHLNPSPAAINFTKLDHFNGLHIRSLTLEDLATRVRPFFVEQGYAADEATLLKIAPIIQERLQGLDDAPELAGFFFRADVIPATQDLLVKGLTAQESSDLAGKILSILEMLPDLKLETTEPPFRELVEQSGLKAGQVFGMMRIAITGQKVSPPLFESMEIIGKEIVVKRMRSAVTMLAEAAQNE